MVEYGVNYCDIMIFGGLFLHHNRDLRLWSSRSRRINPVASPYRYDPLGQIAHASLGVGTVEAEALNYHGIRRWTGQGGRAIHLLCSGLLS